MATLAATGWLRYAAPLPALPGPAWIATLWVAFAMTLQHSLQWLMARPLAAVLFGAIGGPLAYWGASRGFNAVAFTMPVHATRARCPSAGASRCRCWSSSPVAQALNIPSAKEVSA